MVCASRIGTCLMRFTKYLAIVLGLVAVLLAIGWFLRNTIIERISIPMLQQYGLTVADVSLDALATSGASISYLEFAHVNGTIIAIDNLTLPIGISSSGFKTYTAEKITIDLPASRDDVPTALAAMFNQVLALPLQLPLTEIEVAEISAPPYPAIRDVHWQLAENKQQLTALVESTLLMTTIGRTDAANHVLEFSFADAAGASAIQSIMVDIQQTVDGVTLQGRSTLDLPLWMPIAAMLDVDSIDVESGTASLQFDAEFLNDMSRESVLHADFAPTSSVQLTYSGAPDAIASVIVESAGRFEITAVLPGLQWAVRQTAASLLVSYGQWRDIQVSLINQSCRSGLPCSGDIGIIMENVALPFANVNRLELATTQDMWIREDGIEVRIGPDATLGITGISNPDFELARIDARLTSGAALETVDDGWQVSAESVDVGIEAFSLLENVTYSAPVFLDGVSFSEKNQQLSAKMGVYASSSHISWGGRLVRLPGFKGGISVQGTEVAAVLETDGLYEEGKIEASHNLDYETGRLSLINAVLSFDAQELSQRVSPWPNDWNISAGTFAFDLQAEWQKPDAEWQMSGQTSIQMSGLAGAYNDTAFAGLSTGVEAEFDSATGLAVNPSSIAVALVEVGLPVENITADYVLYPTGLSVEVKNLRMSAFGGVVTANPFSFHTAGNRNTLLLHAESIELGEILSIKEFESIEISGSIGAELPVSIEGNSVTIVGGTLTGEPPGGVIRYLPGLAADAADLSGLGLATRALSNFEFETLTAEVNYTRDGDLNLQMQLTGRNPDLDDSRPVILNLGVENNISQMLRSLRAARAVEEILEKRLAQ